MTMQPGLIRCLETEVPRSTLASELIAGQMGLLFVTCAPNSCFSRHLTYARLRAVLARLPFNTSTPPGDECIEVGEPGRNKRTPKGDFLRDLVKAGALSGGKAEMNLGRWFNHHSVPAILFLRFLVFFLVSWPSGGGFSVRSQLCQWDCDGFQDPNALRVERGISVKLDPGLILKAQRRIDLNAQWS